MKLLLTGATGFIGRHLLQKLYEQGHHITICTRNPERLTALFPEVETLPVDFSRAVGVEYWLPHLNGVYAVINAVGIIQETPASSFSNIHTEAPLALFKASEQSGVKRVIQISAAGADSSGSTAYYASKGRADEGLSRLDVDWFVIKPSLVYGPGAKSMGLLRGLAVLPCIPLIGGGRQLLQPVHIDDVVELIMNCLQDSVSPRVSINAVGPAPVSLADLLQKQRLWLGKPKARFFSAPEVLTNVLPFIGNWLDEPALNREAIEMLNQGNTADVEPFARQLGRMPKSMDQALRESVASQADRWHARLYFMSPLLRLSIALVWLWTGWVSAFVYPVADSYRMLEQVGVPQMLHPIVLYGASALDFALGVATLIAWRLRLIVYCQCALMLSYMAVITVVLPEYWVHPFGPLIKNLPLLAASFVLLALEEEKP
ncbi:MAG: NAD(P)H-binding protein [Methylosarcina sp.]